MGGKGGREAGRGWHDQRLAVGHAANGRPGAPRCAVVRGGEPQRWAWGRGVPETPVGHGSTSGEGKHGGVPTNWCQKPRG